MTKRKSRAKTGGDEAMATGAFAQLRQGDPDPGLPCYNEIKQKLGFDPEASIDALLVMDDWGLDKRYPRSLQEMTRDLGSRLGGGDVSGFLYRQAELAKYMKEREGDGNRKTDPAQERADLDGGGDPASGEHPHRQEVGTRWEAGVRADSRGASEILPAVGAGDDRGDEHAGGGRPQD